MKITIKLLLRELAKDIHSLNSRRAAAKLTHKLTTKQSYVLHSYANGEQIEQEYKASRQNLVRIGMMHQYLCPNGTLNNNNQVKTIYALTEKGIAANKEIVEKFTPVVERINAQMEVMA